MNGWTADPFEGAPGGVPPPPPYAGYPTAGGAAAAGYVAPQYGAGAYGGAAAAYGYGSVYGRRGVAAVTGVQDAMARFARVSAAVDDALRSLHLLFDALFGLGVAAKALAAETSVMVRAKSGPVAFVVRLLRRLARLWRLLVLAIISPVDAPLGVILRAIGISTPPPRALEDAVRREEVFNQAFEDGFEGNGEDDANL